MSHCMLHVVRATHVQLEDGSVVLLHPQRRAQRMALARQLLTPGKPGTTRGASKKVLHWEGLWCVEDCMGLTAWGRQAKVPLVLPNKEVLARVVAAVWSRPVRLAQLMRTSLERACHSRSENYLILSPS